MPSCVIHSYQERLKEKLASQFDITAPYVLGADSVKVGATSAGSDDAENTSSAASADDLPRASSFFYDFFAEMQVRHAKFAVSKKVEIYSFDTKEYVLFANRSSEPFGEAPDAPHEATVNPTTIGKLAVESLSHELNHTKQHIPSLVKPNSNQRSSQILLVLAVHEPISAELERFVRKFRYQKGFCFGLKGWADLYPILVSLPENRVISHKNIQKTAEFFLPASLGSTGEPHVANSKLRPAHISSKEAQMNKPSQ